MWFDDPLEEMENLRREIDRVFHVHQPRNLPRFRSAFLPGRAARSYPLINVYEDAEAVYVEALAPGLDTNKLALSVQSGILTISGEKPALDVPDKAAFHRNERAAGSFKRVLDLKTEIDSAKVSAEYERGVLKITLPRHETAKPRQITINVK